MSWSFRRFRRALSGLVLLAGLVAGCATGRRGGVAVSELHLFGVPVALDLDGRPGPDGLGVRIYASAPGVARGIALRQGVLDVLMFEGALGAGELRVTPPRRVWSFEPASLKPFAAETSLGIGYQLALRWDQAGPRTATVTVIARYRAPDGVELWSTANTVSVTAK